MAKMEQIISRVSEDVEQRKFSYTAGGVEIGAVPMESCLALSTKDKSIHTL